MADLNDCDCDFGFTCIMCLTSGDSTTDYECECADCLAERAISPTFDRDELNNRLQAVIADRSAARYVPEVNYTEESIIALFNAIINPQVNPIRRDQLNARLAKTTAVTAVALHHPMPHLTLGLWVNNTTPTQI